MLTRDFTHDSSFTDYMKVVESIIVRSGKPSQTVLDLPAGNGLFAERLTSHGFRVTCGDINQEKAGYVYVNMEQALPFPDESFDFTVCMEGLEHVINPSEFVAELSRVTRKGGHVIITMPNVQNMYSRLVFLFTGEFYQFDPNFKRHPRGRMVDRGHVSALNYSSLNYLFGECGLEPALIEGNKFKKKILMPIYVVLGAFNALWLGWRARGPTAGTPYKLMINLKLMLSRSLIAVWRK